MCKALFVRWKLCSYIFVMADVEEIIDYIKALRKGFDKELFQSKVDELAYAVDTTGLEYDDFHTLFKVWLNLSIRK